MTETEENDGNFHDLGVNLSDESLSTTAENSTTIIVVEGLYNIDGHDKLENLSSRPHEKLENLSNSRIWIIRGCLIIAVLILAIFTLGTVALLKSHNRVKIDPTPPMNTSNEKGIESPSLNPTIPSLPNDHDESIADGISSNSQSDQISEVHIDEKKETP